MGNKKLSLVLTWPVKRCYITVKLVSKSLNKYKAIQIGHNKPLLYLWYCGDIETNPGPTLRQLTAFPISYKERRWIQETSSVLLKILKGIPENSKPKQLWKEKPDDWPPDIQFYDPRNKSTDIPKNDEQLLKCILESCQRKNKNIPLCYQQEINAWIKGDIIVLLELHICRQEISAIEKAIHMLYTYRTTTEFVKMISERNIKIDFGVIISQKYTSTKCMTDIVRDMAVTLCKICHGLDPLKKTDGIWRSPPSHWNISKAFFNPHNAGKRSAKHTDHNLLDDLLQYCEIHNVPIPSAYELFICAWKQKNEEKVRKWYDIYTNILLIEHSIKYLKFEGLMNKPATAERLRNIGLSLEWHKINCCLESSTTDKSITQAGSYRSQSILVETSCSHHDKTSTADNQGMYSTKIDDGSIAADKSFSSAYISDYVKKKTILKRRGQTVSTKRKTDSYDWQYIPTSPDGTSIQYQDTGPSKQKLLIKDNETSSDKDIHAIVSVADELYQDYNISQNSTHETQNYVTASSLTMQPPLYPQQLEIQKKQAVLVNTAYHTGEPIDLHRNSSEINSSALYQKLSSVKCYISSDPLLSQCVAVGREDQQIANITDKPLELHRKSNFRNISKKTEQHLSSVKCHETVDRYVESDNTTDIPITDIELEMNLLEDIDSSLENECMAFDAPTTLPEINLLEA